METFFENQINHRRFDSLSSIAESQTLKLGIVEDSVQMISYWRQCLEGSKSQSLFVTSGENNLQKLLNYVPDVVFCPGVPDHIDGRDLGRIIKSHPQCKNSKVFVHTTLLDNCLFKRWDSRLIAGLLAKPFTNAQLMELLERVKGDAERERRPYLLAAILSSGSNNRSFYRSELENRGYAVKQIDLSNNASREIMNLSPDLIIIDLPGQKQNELDYCRELSISPRTFLTPVIVAKEKTSGAITADEFENGSINTFSRQGDCEQFSTVIKQIQQAPPQDNNRAVIILNEDPVQCSIMGKLLKRSGRSFYICHSIGELEAFLALVVPDIILVSSKLPDGNSVELCQRLCKHKHLADSSIVVISDDDSRQIIAKCLQNGANDFLIKPFSVQEFTARIGNLFHSKKLMTEGNQKKRALQGLSFYDELTGLMNYNYLKAGLGKEIELARKRETELSVLKVEMDDFEQPPSLHANAVIRQIAQMIQRTIRPGDILCRTNHSGFCVLLPSTSTKAAMIVAERIRSTCETAEFTSQRLSRTLSIGISSFPKLSRPESLLYDVGSAMFLSREKGGNRVTAFSKD